MPAENITLKARWKDIEKPTGEIIIGTNKWREFLNKLTFGLFFKDTQEVTINASDNSGTVFVSYLVTIGTSLRRSSALLCTVRMMSRF